MLTRVDIVRMYKTRWPELLRDWTSFWNCYIPNSFMFVKNMNKFFLLVGTMCITKNTLKFISKYQPKQISNIIRIHSWTVSHLSLSIQVVYCRWLRKNQMLQHVLAWSDMFLFQTNCVVLWDKGTPPIFFCFDKMTLYKLLTMTRSNQMLWHVQAWSNMFLFQTNCAVDPTPIFVN